MSLFQAIGAHNAGVGSADAVYAPHMVEAVCRMAGSPSYIADCREQLQAHGALAAVSRRDTAALYAWMVRSFSYQGIGDRAATSFMRRHGTLRYADVAGALQPAAACPKLTSYWHFCDCRYHKGAQTCQHPDLMGRCPLPRHPMRNGRLNQMAYSLFLFTRDIAAGDLVKWIEARLAACNAAGPAQTPAHLAKAADALITPLSHVYGVSYKVLNMALAGLLIGAGQLYPHWLAVGTQMVAVDRLVRNFLRRTGLTLRLGRPHLYGPGCYRPGGCAGLIRAFASVIDARTFNPSFPPVFPRFIQHSIWRYCAQTELNICNAVNTSSIHQCNNVYCRLFQLCDRLS